MSKEFESSGFEERPKEEFLDISEQSLVKPDQYQAIFLPDGHVYVGRLWVFNSVYVLRDIYYFRPTTEEEQAAQAAALKSQGLPEDEIAAQVSATAIVKLGNEMHGPEDQMNIPKGSIRFWENLRDDGNTVQAIFNYQATQAES